MEIYVKSTVSNGLSEYAWYQSKGGVLIPSASPMGQLDENLKFYYSGVCKSPVFYCRSTDAVRRDSWNRPIQNKLYIKGGSDEQMAVGQLACRWLFQNQLFLQTMNSAFKDQDSCFQFHTGWLAGPEREDSLPRCAPDVSLPAFISPEEAGSVFIVHKNTPGKNVRIFASNTLLPAMDQAPFVCITQNSGLAEEWQTCRRRKNRKRTEALAITAAASASLAVGMILYRKKI